MSCEAMTTPRYDATGELRRIAYRTTIATPTQFAIWIAQETAALAPASNASRPGDERRHDGEHREDRERRPDEPATAREQRPAEEQERLDLDRDADRSCRP